MSLTQLRSRGILDGTITAGDFASGVGGKVLQVVSVNWGGEVETTSATFQQVDANFEVSLTPSSASSKILIHMAGGNTYVVQAREMYVQMFRKIAAGSFTGMTVTDVDSNTSHIGYVMRPAGNTGQMQIPHSFNFLDSPNTTSAVTYSPYFKSTTGDAVYFNTPDANNWNINLTIMEIAG